MVASGSKEEVEKAFIFKYSFDAGSFELYDKTEGYYVSYKDVIPLKVEKVDIFLQKYPNAVQSFVILKIFSQLGRIFLIHPSGISQ